MVTIALLTSALTTQNKHHQQIKAESEKERMRANLLRSVSHDIRTPLTTIYGSAATLVDNNEVLSEAQKLKMLESIKQDSDWLVRMVENLLSITRIDSGNVKLTKTPTVVDELVDSVLTKFKKKV
jgi:two-component system sensor histidine kinase KdpD